MLQLVWRSALDAKN